MSIQSERESIICPQTDMPCGSAAYCQGLRDVMNQAGELGTSIEAVATAGDGALPGEIRTVIEGTSCAQQRLQRLAVLSFTGADIVTRTVAGSMCDTTSKGVQQFRNLE